MSQRLALSVSLLGLGTLLAAASFPSMKLDARQSLDNIVMINSTDSYWCVILGKIVDRGDANMMSFLFLLLQSMIMPRFSPPTTFLSFSPFQLISSSPSQDRTHRHRRKRNARRHTNLLLPIRAHLIAAAGPPPRQLLEQRGAPERVQRQRRTLHSARVSSSSSLRLLIQKK